MTVRPRPRPLFKLAATAHDDTGSLPLAMLLTMVGMSLSALLVPMVINQMTATRTSAERTRALHAAQAGIDAALAHIRAATTSTGDGAEEKLPPCELHGTLSTDATLRGPRYRVKITYRDVDGHPMSCPPTDVPATALLAATGTFDAGGKGTRTIEATYTFRTTNQNILGGSIRLDQSSPDRLCMDAGPGDSPTTGTYLSMQLCQPGLSQQQFAYTDDLNIKLIGSERYDALLGMCLDAGSPQATGAYLVLRPCQGRVAHQQWSLNDSSNFQGTIDGVNLNAFCINLQIPNAPGSRLVLGDCGFGADQQIFRPEPGVGAGMAGPATGQLVNYKQFSRCLDVTHFDPTWPYMIVWFCKQAPDGNVAWNQKWTYPTPTAPAVSATGRIGTNGYCLRSPTTTGAYVTMTACDATGLLDPDLTWTVYTDTGDYATSYRIMDTYGNCLTPTNLETTTPDTHGDGTSKGTVAACNATELQKWNAPANLKQPLPLTDIVEE